MFEGIIMKWKRVQIHNHLIGRIDELVSQGVYSSRQSAVSYIIRRQLEFFDFTKVIEDTKLDIFSRLEDIAEILIKLEGRETDDRK